MFFVKFTLILTIIILIVIVLLCICVLFLNSFNQKIYKCNSLNSEVGVINNNSRIIENFKSNNMLSFSGGGIRSIINATGILHGALRRIKKINKRTEQLQLTKNYKSDDDILKRTIIILEKVLKYLTNK